MTRLPIDGQALTLITTGKYRPVPQYAELADGSRRAVPGSQETDGTGTPLWSVDVLLDEEDSDRAQAVSVKVASPSEPQLPKYQPVLFVGLTCKPWVDRRNGNKLTLSFAASGIASGSGASVTSSSAKTSTAGK